MHKIGTKILVILMLSRLREHYVEIVMKTHFCWVHFFVNFKIKALHLTRLNFFLCKTQLNNK